MAGKDEEIVIKIKGDTIDFSRRLKKTKKEVKGLKKTVEEVSRVTPGLIKATAFAFGGLTLAIGGALREASKFEKIEVQFATLTGSVTKAKEVVKDLQQFAATTPFQIEGIAATGKQLLAFGFSTEELIPKLQQIGDVSAATGSALNEVGLVYGKVAANAKLTGETLLQFQERAIPIGPAIAKTMDIAESAVKDMVSKGKVNFEIFEKAFASLSEEGGLAFKGMIKQSKTLGGLISTVGDNISAFATMLGNEFLPTAKKVAQGFIDILQSATKTDSFFSTNVKFWGLYFNSQFPSDIKKSKTAIGEIKGKIEELDKSIEKLKGGRSLFEKIFSGDAPKKDLAEIEKLLSKKKQLETEFKEETKRLLKLEASFKRELKATELEEEKVWAEEIRNRKKEDREILLEMEMELRERDKLQILAEKEAELLAEKKHKEAMAQIKLKELKTSADVKRAFDEDEEKKRVKKNNKELKEIEKHGGFVAALNRGARSDEFNAASQMFDNLAMLGKTGDRKLMAIAKSAAIARASMSMYTGAAKALEFGPFLGPPLAATVLAAGAVRIAQISKQGFAKGGEVTGGMPFRDSVNIVAQRGELVAPRNNFEEVIGSVRAARAQNELARSGQGEAKSEVAVTIGFVDNAFEIIEEKLLERRAIGIGVL